MLQSDREYYRQRAVAAREMAEDAANAEVAAIHKELARQYDALAERPELECSAPSSFNFSG